MLMIARGHLWQCSNCALQLMLTMLATVAHFGPALDVNMLTNQNFKTKSLASDALDVGVCTSNHGQDSVCACGRVHLQ